MLTDLTGKVIVTSNESGIDIEGIKNGFYIVIIYMNTGQIIEKKIITNAL